MRVLALALGVPFPPIGGGLARTFHLLKSLASHHEVALAAFTYGEPHEAPPYPLRVRAIPWQWSADYVEMTGADARAAHQAYERLTFSIDEPWFASVMDRSGMDAVVAVEMQTGPDLVLIEGTPMAKFLPAIPRDVPRVLDLFDIHTVMARRDATDSAGPDRKALERESERTLAFERTAALGCDACLAVSEEDAVVARELLTAPTVHIVPNGVDTSYFAPASVDTETGMVLFTGRMNYPPNVEAVRYFAESILPLLRREMPRARFHIVGAAPPPEVSALASDAVVVHGLVDDIRAYQERAEVVVVPILSGGGTRLKVLEAAASGKPIVTTSRGIEGLPLRDGTDVLIADGAAEFAAAVDALLRDPARRRELGINARASIAALSWTRIGESFRHILEGLLRDRE